MFGLILIRAVVNIKALSALRGLCRPDFNFFRKRDGLKCPKKMFFGFFWVFLGFLVAFFVFGVLVFSLCVVVYDSNALIGADLRYDQ